jgi:type IV pilus assembly protein PilX
MKYSRRLLHASPPARRQGGVALIVALVLLLVITVLGLASMRGTALQERMSANMFDRSIAFQRSEAALRAAEAAITANWEIATLGGTDCSPDTGTACPLVPDNTFADDDDEWIDVSGTHDVNAAMSPGTAQYQIQFLGTGPSESDYGVEANADYGNYGNPYPPDDVAYYRVTTRSSNPGDADDRAVVVLQSTFKRAF